MSQKFPRRHASRDGWTKSLLRQALADDMPREILQRRRSSATRRRRAPGFCAMDWRAARELLLDPRTLGRGILDGSRVERALRSYVRGPALYRAHRTGRIWTWLTLELWFRQFID